MYRFFLGISHIPIFFKKGMYQFFFGISHIPNFQEKICTVLFWDIQITDLSDFLLSYVLRSAVQFSPVQFNFQNWSIVKLRDTSFLISDPFHSIRLIFSSIHPIRKIKPFQGEKNADVRVMFWKCQKLKSELDPHNFNLIVATCPEKGCSCS